MKKFFFISIVIFTIPFFSSASNFATSSGSDSFYHTIAPATGDTICTYFIESGNTRQYPPASTDVSTLGYVPLTWFISYYLPDMVFCPATNALASIQAIGYQNFQYSGGIVTMGSSTDIVLPSTASVSIVQPQMFQNSSTTVPVVANVSYGNYVASSWDFVLYYGTTSTNLDQSLDVVVSGYPSQIQFQNNWTNGTWFAYVSMNEAVGSSSEVYSEIATSSVILFYVNSSNDNASTSPSTDWSAQNWASLDAITRESVRDSYASSTCGVSTTTSSLFTYFESFSNAFLCGFVDAATLIILPSRSTLSDVSSSVTDVMTNSFPFSLFYRLKNEVTYYSTSTATSTYVQLVPSSIIPPTLPTTSPAYALESLGTTTPLIVSALYSQDKYFADSDFWQGAVKTVFKWAIGFAFGLYVLMRGFSLIGFSFGQHYNVSEDWNESETFVGDGRGRWRGGRSVVTHHKRYRKLY